jgi:hypothetical protein
MNPKVSMYQTDGFGRDTYIKEPNGGFRKSWTNIYHQNYYNKMSLTDYLKSCDINPKFPIYRANGTGRDMYIKRNCGGFYHSNNYPVHYSKFFGELRNYEYDPIVNERLVKSKYDYQRYVKMFRTKHKFLFQRRKLKKKSPTIVVLYNNNINGALRYERHAFLIRTNIDNI